MADPKKLFNSNEYITKIIAGSEDAFSSEEYKNDTITSLIELLTSPENRDFREEALLVLKKEKAGELLIKAIKKNKKHRPVLVAACWESEIDFSNQFNFFISLALDEDYLVSLEAITVIATMAGPFKENEVKDAVAKVKEEQQKMNSERVVLLNDLLNTLQNFLN